MTVRGFEVGKFYRFTNKDYRAGDWNIEMNAWKDGDARKCLMVTSSGLEGEFTRIVGLWTYINCMHFFEEVSEAQYIADTQRVLSIDKVKFTRHIYTQAAQEYYRENP